MYLALFLNTYRKFDKRSCHLRHSPVAVTVHYRSKIPARLNFHSFSKHKATCDVDFAAAPAAKRELKGRAYLSLHVAA